MAPSATTTAIDSDVEQQVVAIEMRNFTPNDSATTRNGTTALLDGVVETPCGNKQRHSSVRSTPPLTPPSTDNNKRSSRGKRFRKFLNNNNIDDANIIDDTSSHGLKSTSLNRRKRGKACSRRLMGLVLFAGTGLCVFHVGWWAYWGSRCHEGCYEKSTAPTGTQGPEQVHVAYSGADTDGNPTGMALVWTTAAGETPPMVEYGLTPDNLNLTAEGTSIRYLETVHHRATLDELAPGTRFYYRCGHPSAEGDTEDERQESDALKEDGDRTTNEQRRHSPDLDVTISGNPETRGNGDDGRWSSVSSFVAAPSTQRWAGDGPWDRPVSVAVVGDWGLVNAGTTFERLHQLVEDDEIDFVLHLGDIAYADDAFLERPWAFGYEEKWDAFMRRVSHDFASRVPYMVVPGNHEAECHSPACLFSARKTESLGHFNAYNARFRMPSLESGAEHGTAMWYSFNLGPVHWVVIDTETDFPDAPGDKYTLIGDDDDGVGNGGFGDQIAWLEEDLAKADQERNARPWIVVAGHRPMYSKEGMTLSGLPNGNSERVRKAFEPLLMRYKADVYLSGHVHTYERSYPVYGEHTYFDVEHAEIPTLLYDDPVAPVHIVNGAGGNIEGMTPPKPVPRRGVPKWHARSLRLTEGVGILTFDSVNQMRASFVTSTSPAEIQDELTIRHHRHAADGGDELDEEALQP